MQIFKREVTNYSEGRQKYKPEAIVIQMLNSNIESAITRSSDKTKKSSFHYLVAKSGDVWMLVDDKNTAWHSPGVAHSNWKYAKPDIDPNLYTIGIGIEGKIGKKVDSKLYLQVAQLVKKITQRWEIEVSPDRVIGVEKLNKLAKQHNPGFSINFDRLINLVSDIPETEDIEIMDDTEKDMQNEIAQLTKTIGNLELRCAALESELNEQSNPKASAEELKELLVQNTKMAEEIYLLQQEKHKAEDETSTLQKLIDREKSSVSLEAFGFMQLIRAIINKLTKPIRQ